MRIVGIFWILQVLANAAGESMTTNAPLTSLSANTTIATPTFTMVTTPSGSGTSSMANDNDSDSGTDFHFIEELPISEVLRLPEAIDGDRVLEEESRHFLCIPLLRIFNLELRQPLQTGEHIALVGSHSRLGEWQLDASIEMRSLDGDRLEWLAKVPICANERIAYRYFIYTLDGEQKRRVRVWEGQQHPRVMESYEIYRQPGVDYFGETAGTAIDVGGREGMWLRYEHLIELKFVWQRQLRLQRQVRHKVGHRVRLKLAIMGKVKPWAEGTVIEVSRYAYNRSEFRQQPPDGVVYNFDGGGDIVVFRITEPLRVRNSYKLSIYTVSRVLVGDVIIFHLDLKNTEGVIRLPVHSASTGFEIGQLTLPYLNVQPLPQAELLNMRGSYQHFWPLNWPTMHVGNRGTGKSFYDSRAPYVENTIRSILNTHALRGDMVELDVQLTRDYVPVVWHEYGFYTAPQGRRVHSILELDYKLVRELNYQDLKRQRVFVLRRGIGIEEVTYLNVRRKRTLERIFPKLAEVYQRLPKTLGLIIDIKSPQKFHGPTNDDSSDEDADDVPALDKNRVVDTLLAITAQHGCGRPLIYASFDADICTLLRYKQNVYPALFLTIGNTKRWQPFRDLRTRTFANAVNFAQSESLLGTAPHVGNFLERPRQIELGLDLNQVVFLWGEELRNSQLLDRFESLHATGLIYDRVDLQLTDEKRFKFFAARELSELFERQCTSTLTNATAGSEMQQGSKAKRKFITIRVQH